MRSSPLVPALVVAGSIGLGFALTSGGVATWDSLPHLDRSRWLVHELGLPSSRTSNGLTQMLKWYGPLWALFLGLLSEVVLPFFRDPLWVQQAFNFALFPSGLYAVHRLLARAGVRRSTAWLAVALLLGAIRLGGHALVNVNDFPFAMLSLLVMLHLWSRLREASAAGPALAGFSRRTLVVLGVVAMVPFLVRPPVLVQPATLLGALAFIAVAVPSGAGRGRRIGMVALPALAGLGFAVAIWPSLWERGRTLPLRTAISGFIRFAWVGTVRYFGHAAMSTALPWFYPFVWLPVILNPLAYLLLVIGLLRYLARPRLVAQSWLLDSRWGPVDLSLRRWLALHATLFWLGVLVLRPTLYDEERHLLFLYPPLLVLAALGLDDLGERLKYALAALVIASSLLSYAGWGRYAYVYKSPLVGNRHADRFSGDYWGVCVPLAVAALEGRVPPGAEVVVFEPYDAAVAEYQRLREGRWSRRPGFGPYRFVRKSSSPTAVYILYNRNGFNARAVQAVHDGSATLVWQTSMPPGDPACIIVSGPHGS